MGFLNDTIGHEEAEKVRQHQRQALSQAQVIGLPRVKTWDDYEQGCLASFGGGHRTDGHLEAFRHGMATVFNLLRHEFPPAEQCQAAPAMLTELKMLRDWIPQYMEGEEVESVLEDIEDAIALATSPVSAPASAATTTTC